ncbi:hypothetical protein pb186bvf_001714 [Paramecium bursaria]
MIRMNQQTLKLEPIKVRKQMSVETLKKKRSFYNQQPDEKYKQMVRYEQMLSSLLRQKYEEKRNQVATKEFLPLMIDQKSKILIARDLQPSQQTDRQPYTKKISPLRSSQISNRQQRASSMIYLEGIKLNQNIKSQRLETERPDNEQLLKNQSFPLKKTRTIEYRKLSYNVVEDIQKTPCFGQQ